MMKKLCLMTLGLLVSMLASAYTCVTFKAGDPSVLLKKASVSYEVDWDHARVTNWDNLLFPEYLKKRGDDFVRDWPEDRRKVEEYFTVRFNKKSDYLKITRNEDGDYKLILRPKTIDVGNGGSMFNPWSGSKAGGVIINGTIEIRDRSGKLLCVLNVIDAKGGSHMSETTRIGLCLMEIAGDFHDFVDDEVKDGNIKATSVGTDTSTPAASPAPEPEKKPAAEPAPARKQDKKEPAASKDTKPAVQATGGEVRVTLKNGSVIIGKVKAFDPTESITLFVAGITTTIKMSDVEQVEDVK